MKKRKMLSLALVFALIMSLVPVSGLAAEPSVFMDPGAVMQEDAEEAVSTEAANAENGEELFSPDMDEAEGQVSGEASGETEKLTGEPGADHAFEEEPVPEDMGADQALEGEPAAEPVEEETGADQAVSEEAPEEEPGEKDSGADQAFREEPAAEETGADQVLEEEPAAEENPEDRGEEPFGGDAFAEDETAVDEAVAGENAAEEAAASAEEETVETVDTESTEDTVDSPAANEAEEGFSYVLMNIPYADFYAAELAPGSEPVDAVTSATKNKPRTGTLAGGSYHVDPAGTDISGVIFPVKVGKGFQLDPAKQITDDASLSITVTLRGKEVTTEYHGRETLFEAPDYSWYALSAEEVPTYYKEARTNHGNTSFGPAVGEVISAQADAVITAKARHADYEIKLTPDEGVLDQATDVVSAAVLTDSEGNTYGLRHVANIWRVTEVDFNRDEPAGALAGKKITNIRYYLKDRIIDLSVDLDIPVLTSAVTLDKTSVSMLEGRTAVLTASVEPDGTFWPLYWSSSNENVVGVDQNGILTAVAAGTATVTAEAADNTGVSAVCQVTVTKPVSAITLDKTSASVLAGKTVAIKATVKPDDAGSKDVSWISSDKKIATVDAKGVVKGLAKGTATITAKAKDGSGIKATCKITVKQPVTKITLSKTPDVMLMGKTITLKATADPAADDKSIVWTTSDKNVATVSSNGVVKGIAKGGVTITAAAKDGSGVKASCRIIVRQPVTRITLNRTSASILKGKTVKIQAASAPSTANVKYVTWTTSNKKVATVTANGVVKGIAKGSATITATAKDGSGVKAACKVTVKQPVTKLTINKTKLTVKAGKTAALKVTVAPSNANDKSLKWTSSNQKIATVTQKGVVKGIKRGTVTITAAAKDGSGKKVTCKVTVQ